MFKFPISIEIDITSCCNLNCNYCRNATFGGDGDMELYVLRFLINECIDNSIFQLSISGGEPTLHHDFWEVVSLLGELPYGWSLTTNGTTSDEKLIKHLSSNGLKSVFITLAGFTSETEKKHKGKNYCMSKVLDAIGLYKQYGTSITLGYILTPYNKHEIDDFCVFCIDNNIHAKLMKVENMGNGCDNKLQVSEEEYLAVLDGFKDKLGKYCVLGEQNHPVYDNHCKAGVVYCVVGYDTNVYPCVRFLGNRNFACGSVKEKSLLSIWQNSSILESFRSPRVFQKKCEKCTMKFKCQGGCRAKAFEQYGDYTKSQDCNCYV